MSENNALLVIDCQVEVLNGTWNTESVLTNINQIIGHARQKGYEIIWIMHNDEELIKDSEGWKIHPELNPLEEEIIISKNYNSAFEDTELSDYLTKKGVKNLFLCGAATNWCVRSTLFAAVEKNYFVTLFDDAHTTVDMKFKDGFQITAEAIITDLNMNALYLNYKEKKMTGMSTKEFLEGK